MQKLLSGREVAKRLNVCPKTVTNWRRKGILVPEIIYSTNRVKYTEEQIIAYEQSIRGGGRT